MLKHAFLGFAVSWALATGAGAQEPTIETDIQSVAKEIAAAESEASKYEGGLILTMIQLRLQTLKLTKSLLDQRLLANRNGIDVIPSLEARKPDPETLKAASGDLLQAERELKQALAESEASGGLVGTMALVQVATIKTQIAALKLAAYQAAYGLNFQLGPPTPAQQTDLSDAGTSSKSDMASITQPDHADPAHPEIDYNLPVLVAAARDPKTKLSGWWSINAGEASIDDSPEIVATNLSAAAAKSSMIGDNPMLVIRCTEGTTSLIYFVDEYLLADSDAPGLKVTYRIDKEKAATEYWSETTTHTAVGLFGSNAIKMARRLQSATELFLRVEERNGESHDLKVSLAGVGKVIDAVSSACKWTI